MTGTLIFGAVASPETRPFCVLGELPHLITPPDRGCPACIYRANLCRESVDILPCEHPLIVRYDSGEVREI